MHGGVLEYLYMFFKNFKDENYENILIVSQDYENKLDKFKDVVKDIYVVNMIREIKLKQDIKSTLEIRKLLKKIKPDILYLHSSKAGAYGRIALFFNHKVKVLYNAHGWYFNAKMSQKKKKAIILIEKILALRANKIINISKSEYDSALKYKIAPERKMCVIENGIDFTKFEGCDKYREETRKKYNIGDNEIVIGVVGRVTETKDPITTLKAFKNLCKSKPNLKLMYVGAGDLEENVIQSAKEYNILDKIIITGWVNSVEKYIPAFDIAVLPSQWEGFGLALIEYMACDKPIIASNVGGIINIIKDKKNGLIFKAHEYEDLIEKMKILIENNIIVKNIVQENREYRKAYDIKLLIEKHEKLFKTL